MSTFAREAAEAAAGARRQLTTCAAAFDDLAHRLTAHPPPLVVTCARGSSDHAATYGQYVLGTTLGRVVTSLAPSLASSYARVPRDLDGALVLAVSQSGASPDLVRSAETARAAGAYVVGFINVEGSPLAAACDLVIPLCAGPETGVAATKSFLLAGLAFLQLAAAWSNDPHLRDTIARAPDAFAAAHALPWAPALTSLATATSAFVVGRGVGLGPAFELALKLKETCRLHAEGFSTAEVLHGPLALVEPGFPVLALGQDDETAPTTRAALARLVALGADVCSTVALDGVTLLPTVRDLPAILQPLCAVQSMYAALPSLAARRGCDPDTPRHLAKVTRTS